QHRTGRLPRHHPGRAGFHPGRGRRRHHDGAGLRADTGLCESFHQHPRHWSLCDRAISGHDPCPAHSSLRALRHKKGRARMSESISAATTSPTSGTVSRGFFGSARSRLLLFAGLLLSVLFLVGGDSWLSVLDTAMIAAIATLGLNVLSGYTGQISLGIAFFMAIGAYTAAWLGGRPPLFPDDPVGHSLPFLIWLPAAGVVAALLAALIGPTALRLKGFYLGIVTLALIFIGQFLFNNLRSITGGPQGRSVPQPAFGEFSFASPNPILGIQFTTNQLYFLLLVVVLGLAGLFVANIARSR